MLSELREDLFKSTSSNRKVGDQVLLKSHGAKISEDLMKSNLSFGLLQNFILRFENLICLWLTLYLEGLELTREGNCFFSSEVLAVLCDVSIDIFGSREMLHVDTVTFSVSRFQMSWRTIGYKKTVYHDSNVVTKGFSLIHSMSSQNK
jgi:hypothetical protein